MTIDWDFIAESYNNINDTKLNFEEVLLESYKKFGAVSKVADYLGVSNKTLSKKMDILNIPRHKKLRFAKPLRERMLEIPAEKMAKMTAKQIAQRVKCHPATVNGYAIELGRTYKMKPKPWIRGARHERKRTR